MRAIIQEQTGGPEVLTLRQTDDLTPGPGQVRISVEVAGVHLVDTVIRSGAWGEVDLPMTPGREVAGRIDMLGDDVDQAWLGRQVVVHLGLASGGYAEQAVTDVARVHVVPEGLDPATAVAAIGTGRTAVLVLDAGPVGPEDRVVVTAASGGLGVLLTRAALGAGASVVGLANGPAKAEVVAGLGARVVDVTEPGWAAQVGEAVGTPTLAYDGVGGDVRETLLGLIDPHGVLVDYTGAEVTERPAGSPEVRPVLGPDWQTRRGGLRRTETEALERAADGSRLPLVGSTFPLADAAAAHRALEARETHGKVVLLT
ncbi:alcohol dehydrogenase catalytic domain-containing protein [Aeromicrobium sp. CTD01-1L150]|uniref:alcohol dehydrogenase catalytic domain-containing protein n=1 Tax=Aeromicrobium sp. CTD01-1L150 TaxID=3341830 RepID=UPI0035BF9640